MSQTDKKLPEIFGYLYCPYCKEAAHFFHKEKRHYIPKMMELKKVRRELLKRLTKLRISIAQTEVPIIFFPSGIYLIRPSKQELLKALLDA